MWSSAEATDQTWTARGVAMGLADNITNNALHHLALSIHPCAPASRFTTREHYHEASPVRSLPNQRGTGFHFHSPHAWGMHGRAWDAIYTHSGDYWGSPKCHIGYESLFRDPRGLRKLRSSVEAVFGWKSYLHIMGELPDAKNRAKKAARGQECTYKVVLRSLLCAETAHRQI